MRFGYIGRAVSETGCPSKEFSYGCLRVGVACFVTDGGKWFRVRGEVVVVELKVGAGELTKAEQLNCGSVLFMTYAKHYYTSFCHLTSFWN
jgi:hypothetical protein